MDHLRKVANGAGFWKGVLAFLIFSGLIATIGWLLGVFDHNPDDAGGPRIIYEPPTSERPY